MHSRISIRAWRSQRCQVARANWPSVRVPLDRHVSKEKWTIGPNCNNWQTPSRNDYVRDRLQRAAVDQHLQAVRDSNEEPRRTWALKGFSRHSSTLSSHCIKLPLVHSIAQLPTALRARTDAFWRQALSHGRLAEKRRIRDPVKHKLWWVLRGDFSFAPTSFFVDRLPQTR